MYIKAKSCVKVNNSLSSFVASDTGVRELQTALNAMFAYCNMWDLQVNEDKTKIVVFGSSKAKNVPDLLYNGKKTH